MNKIMRLSPKYFLTLKEPDSQHLFPYDLACAGQGNTAMANPRRPSALTPGPSRLACWGPRATLGIRPEHSQHRLLVRPRCCLSCSSGTLWGCLACPVPPAHPHGPKPSHLV